MSQTANASDCVLQHPTILAAFDGEPGQVASDGHNVYALSGADVLSGHAIIRRIGIQTHASEILINGATGFALTEGRLFYSGGSGNSDQSYLPRPGEVGEFLSAGKVAVLTNQPSAWSLAANSSRLYWATNSDLDHVAPSLFSISQAGGGVSTIAVDNQVGLIRATNKAIYWSQYTAMGETVVRADLDGSQQVVVAKDVSLSLVDADDDRLVFAGGWFLGGNPPGLQVGRTAGGTLANVVSDVPVYSAVIDGENIYYGVVDDLAEAGSCRAAVSRVNGNGAAICGGKIMRVPAVGGTPTLVAQTTGLPYRLAVDSSCVYALELVGPCGLPCSSNLSAAPK